jgi:hypothetical protein
MVRLFVRVPLTHTGAFPLTFSPVEPSIVVGHSLIIENRIPELSGLIGNLIAYLSGLSDGLSARVNGT